VRVGILGAAEARIDGAPVDLGTRKQRALLAALAMRRGQPVGQDALVDLLWGDAPPTAVTATLQGYVARLRRALEPDRAPRAPSEVLVTQQTGYALILPEDALDAARFESAVGSVHQRLGTGMTSELGSAELEELFARLNEGLSLWRGLPYTELEDAPAAQAERARLEELRAMAMEDRAVASLGLGRHAIVAGELEVLTSTYPLRERLWGLRALALTRSGRQADALEVLRQVRELLADELGLEPGAELRALQTAVLRQDPELEWTEVRPLPRQRGPATRPRDFAWPLVGRDDQLSALVGLLEQSADQPAFAVITGDPGIGKSRLCAELAATATAEGVDVVVGRCSQDDGAPPLYPWASVLKELGHDLPSGTLEAEGDSTSRFRAWESIARTVLDAAAERHLLVVLDDLHWADSSTLRVLRLLAESAETGRLLVVATWRHEPPPTGQLAEVAEMMARRHALRLQLTGLSATEAGEIVTSVADSIPTATEADALQVRTDGNPFFLVEYARLARDGGDLTALLGEEHPPAAVQDVLTRRLGGLPDETAAALRVACVVGRYFDVPTLAEVLQTREDEVLDHLDPALHAGLVREFDVDRFRFAHALVRDTAYAALSQSRRARMHARVAEVLADQPGRESEVARHWLTAGPQHAAQAWPAAVSAATAARRVYAYDEAADLLTHALDAVVADPAADRRDECGVVLELAHALQRTGNWLDLRPMVHRALTLAGELEDLDLLVAAATMSLGNALWQTAQHGEVDPVVVDALRSALDRLPSGDSEQRCRVMLSLAGELYYASTPSEREALADESVAMARRLAEPRLLLWALMGYPTCIWRSGNAQQRYDLTAEAAALAEELGAGVTLSSALTLHVAAAGELGRVEEIDDGVRRAREQADREHHHYAHLVLDSFEVPWAAMRGEFDRADALIADLEGRRQQTSIGQTEDAIAGALAMRMLWAGQVAELVELMGRLREVSVLPVESTITALLCRVGREAEARQFLEEHDLDISGDWWFSPMIWAMAAETSMYLRLPDLAATTYGLLLDLKGRPASAGSGTALGPVDAFLAMAAEATGERDLATRHAQDASRLCEEWRIPLAGEWFARIRSKHGF
jgi:DNA-binding SARP family transcriptional activator